MPILEPVTANKYTVKQSCNFACGIADQDSSNLMGSLDIDSLFTKIQIEDNEIVHGLEKVSLKIYP